MKPHSSIVHFHILSLAELTVLFMTGRKNCRCLKKDNIDEQSNTAIADGQHLA